jgi:hypothetical protein
MSRAIDDAGRITVDPFIDRTFPMLSASTPEPDPSGAIIYVGQDGAGHWLVQLSSKQMEGRFVSFAAAMSYAQSERDMYHAAVEIASAPIQPLVSFAPLAADERAQPQCQRSA